MSSEAGNRASDDYVVPPQAVPAEELGRYRFERDPHDEREIARYVETEARDESVQHVELVKTEVVVGMEHEIWDVTTDKDRYWVITNLANLYSQRHFSFGLHDFLSRWLDDAPP